MSNKEILGLGVYLKSNGWGNSNKIVEYILNLKNENKKIKKLLENNSKINIADHKYASTMEDKYLIEHNILIEFEKWLEETEKRKNARWEQFANQKNRQEIVLERLDAQITFIDSCLEKLQELKGESDKNRS